MTQDELKKLLERNNVLGKLFEFCEDVHSVSMTNKTSDGRWAFSVVSHSPNVVAEERVIDIDGKQIPVIIKKSPHGPVPA